MTQPEPIDVVLDPDCPRCEIAILASFADQRRFWRRLLLAILIPGLLLPALNMATGVYSVPIALLFFLPALPVLAAVLRLRSEAQSLIADAQQLIREQLAAVPDHRISGIRHSHAIEAEVICDGCIADVLGDGLVLHDH